MPTKAKDEPKAVDAPVPETIDGLKAENAALRAELAALKGEAVYVPKPYPAVRYHKDGRTPVTVIDEVADKELGPDWSDTPPAPSANPYPAWRYHATLEPRMVKNADEDAALGPGWKKPADLS